MLTTVQDLGRPGYAGFGVSPSGAMDPIAHRLGNVLVGNPQAAAALEITGPGTEIGFLVAHRFALAGADLGARLNGVPLPAVFVGTAPSGAQLVFTQRIRGARATLAFAQGLWAPVVFGSAATDLGGGLGGSASSPGAVLRAGHRLAVAAGTVAPGAGGTGDTADLAPGRQWAQLAGLLRPLARLTDPPDRLRYVVEPEGGATAATQAAFRRHSFRVSSRSNRTGYRFEGQPLIAPVDPDRLSEPTAPGAIQLPPDGRPILLMADRNTTGGYPRLGHLISADRSRAAQLWPDDPVSFVPVSATAALTAARAAESALQELLRALTKTLYPPR